MYKAMDIARYIIGRRSHQNKTMNNLKLQKILYFVQAEFLVTTGQACFSEQIEAWDIGPVVPEVYHNYKVFGSASIPVIEKVPDYVPISEQDMKLIDDMMDKCSKYTSIDLLDITHNQSPWRDAYIRGLKNIITNEAIADYFKEDEMER